MRPKQPSGPPMTLGKFTASAAYHFAPSLNWIIDQELSERSAKRGQAESFPRATDYTNRQLKLEQLHRMDRIEGDSDSYVGRPEKSAPLTGISRSPFETV
jgi:hypothetical protein